MYSSYKQNELQAIPHNQLEAITLIKSASRLNRVKEDWKNLVKTELVPALEHNRKLWTILASELADIEHPMDHDLRQNIASLALFVFKHTIKVMADKEPRPKDIDILITINMEIAKGLNEFIEVTDDSAIDTNLASASDSDSENQSDLSVAQSELTDNSNSDTNSETENAEEIEEEVFFPSNFSV